MAQQETDHFFSMEGMKNLAQFQVFVVCFQLLISVTMCVFTILPGNHSIGYLAVKGRGGVWVWVTFFHWVWNGREI